MLQLSEHTKKYRIQKYQVPKGVLQPTTHLPDPLLACLIRI